MTASPRDRPAAPAAPADARCTLISHRRSARCIVVPVVFGVLGGFKDNGQLSTNPFGLPDPWVPANYTDILASGVFWRQLGNSTLIARGHRRSSSSASRRMAAFVFARFAFRGRELLFTLFADRADVPVRGGDPAAVHPAAQPRTCWTTRSA